MRRTAAHPTKSPNSGEAITLANRDESGLARVDRRLGAVSNARRYYVAPTEYRIEGTRSAGATEYQTL
jgi:hypothetical protein